MVWGLPRCVWARESTVPAQGNQSVSRELRASALCPGLEARFPARQREERGCGPLNGKDRVSCQSGGAPALRPGAIASTYPFSAPPTTTPTQSLLIQSQPNLRPRLVLFLLQRAFSPSPWLDNSSAERLRWGERWSQNTRALSEHSLPLPTTFSDVFPYTTCAGMEAPRTRNVTSSVGRQTKRSTDIQER